jgi:Methane oxygenase PmoA
VKTRTNFQRSALALVCCASLNAGSVNLNRGSDKIDVTIDQRPFTTYYFAPDIAKPYLMPLRTASGIVISRSFPVANSVSEADRKTRSFEPHQRPLYFDHGNIDGLNFWSEETFTRYYHSHDRQAYGHMALKEVEQVNGGTVRARFNLLAPSGRVLAEEIQTLRFSGDDRTRIIDCEFVIDANHGPVTFGDSKEGTFAVRLGPELSAPNNHMLNSNGAQGEPAIWGKPADWVAYSGTVSGKPVTVAVLDHPKSFRHPTTWHARAYGLLAANPFGFREFSNDPSKDGSWTVPEHQSLTFRYRVIIDEGHLTGPELTDLYRQYAALQ